MSLAISLWGCQIMYRNRGNEAEKESYLFEHILWSAVTYFLFGATLFRPLNVPIFGERLTYAQTKGILLLLIVVCDTAGIIDSYKNGCNGTQLTITVTAPYGAYLILATLPHIPIYLYLVGGIALFAICYQLALLISTPIQYGYDITRVLRNRFRRLVYNIRTLVNALLALIVAVTALCAVFSTVSPALFRNQTSQNNVEEKTISSCKAELAYLREEKWRNLSWSEKLELLQLVADIEVDYLGLPDRLDVKVVSMDDEWQGGYLHGERLILINSTHLQNDSAEDCINTILHEVKHSEQNHLCDALEQIDESYIDLRFFSEVERYQFEFLHYNHGIDNYSEYYRQVCEENARDYAKVRYPDYAWELEHFS